MIADVRLPFQAKLRFKHELKAAIDFARTAPSARNIQPWLFAYSVEAAALDLILDVERPRPVADPLDREQVIGCGVALEFAHIALAAAGVGHSVTLFPRPYDCHTLARINLSGRVDRPDQRAKQLLNAAKRRHTNWGPFAADPVCEADIAELIRVSPTLQSTLVQLTAPQLESVARLIRRAEQRQDADPEFQAELRRWPVGRPSASRASSIVRHLKSPFPDSGGTVFALTTPTDNVEDWLEAGRALAQVLLSATLLGLSATFMNQPLQLTDLRDAVAQTIGTTELPQQLVRFGHALTAAPETRRRSLDEVRVAWDPL